MRVQAISLAFGIFLLVSAANSAPRSIPRMEVTTLTGQPVAFPKIGSEKPLLLMLGFSHKSGTEMQNWTKHFKIHYALDPRVDFYELADLQGVPSFVVKMIVHGMRRSVPEPARSHFAPFYSEEEEWKKLVGFNDPNIAYIVLANAKGDVVWQTHGPASDATAAELEAAVVKLLPAQK